MIIHSLGPAPPRHLGHASLGRACPPGLLAPFRVTRQLAASPHVCRDSEGQGGKEGRRVGLHPRGPLSKHKTWWPAACPALNLIQAQP